MSIELVEDLVDADVPDLFAVRVNRSPMFPSVFIFSYAGKRWLIATFYPRTCLPTLYPMAFTSTNVKTIERIQKKAQGNCTYINATRVLNDLMYSPSVTFHTLYLGYNVTGRAHYAAAVMPYLSLVTHSLPQALVCMCFRESKMAIPLQKASEVKEGAADNRLTIDFGYSLEKKDLAVCCLSQAAGINKYSFKFNGQVLVA